MTRYSTSSVMGFVVLSVAVSWIAAGIILVLLRIDGQAPALLFLLVAKFGPTLAGATIVGLHGGESALRGLLGPLGRWRVSWRWYFVALVGPVLLLGGGTALARTIEPGQGIAGIGWPVEMGLLVPLFLRHVFLGGGLGEEVGWRGFLLPQLQMRVGPLAASAVIGPIWAVWHAPMFVMPGGWDDGPPLTGLLLYLALTLPLSVLFTWVYNGTRGSLLVVVALHAAINTVGASLERIVPITESTLADDWVQVGLLWVAAAIVLARTGPRLGWVEGLDHRRNRHDEDEGGHHPDGSATPQPGVVGQFGDEHLEDGDVE